MRLGSDNKPLEAFREPSEKGRSTGLHTLNIEQFEKLSTICAIARYLVRRRGLMRAQAKTIAATAMEFALDLALGEEGKK